MISNIRLHTAKALLSLCCVACLTFPAARAQPVSAVGGVYNGTYTCAQGSTTLKLSVMPTANGDLYALFTFYPPRGTQNQPYTYSLQGQYDPKTAKLSLTPLRWETASPPDFGMVGLDGTVTAGELAGTVTGPGCRGFNVERSAAESANIGAVMAAQKSGTNPAAPAAATPSQPPAEDAFTKALRAQAPAGVQLPPSAVPPAQPAPAPVTAGAGTATSTPAAIPAPASAPARVTIVEKPGDYWSGYRTDMIRQVFDGGFGSDVDADPEFKLLFNTYVEAFSSNCSTYLPANHQSVVVSKVTTRTDRYGNVTQQSNETQGTVEVDPRFATMYTAYGNALSSSANGLRVAMGVASGRSSLADTMAPARDVFQFFKAETCDSPAMRQLGDNLLRGATGERSLQLSAAAAGSAAPAFTHFGDACNAYYRNPANARYAPSDATGYCRCLADKYRFTMNHEEEAYFAADFRAHYLDDIAQPKNSGSHPAWNKLHPATVACAR
jgi:hypothetical protein